MRMDIRRMKEAFCGCGIPEDDARMEAAEIYRCVVGAEPGLRQDGEWDVSCEQQRKMREASIRRCRREPIQYILGEWDFMDMTLFLGPGVFIPRSDTETVAEEAIRLARAAGNEAEVLDLCSGSGAIALSVARHVPRSRVTAVEFSQKACEYLQKNNKKYEECVIIQQADVYRFQDTLKPESIDVLVSNPPYIAPEEKDSLLPELSYEPPEALFAGDRGLAFYRHIAPAYYPALRPGGALVFETGSTQTQAVAEICRAAGYRDIRILQDLSHNPRCVTAHK